MNMNLAIKLGLMIVVAVLGFIAEQEQQPSKDEDG
jgi:hypothetical protein